MMLSKQFLSRAMLRAEMLYDDTWTAKAGLSDAPFIEADRHTHIPRGMSHLAGNILSVERAVMNLRYVLKNMPKQKFDQAMREIADHAQQGGSPSVVWPEGFEQLSRTAHGRDLRAGTERGLGLEWGTLQEQIHQDPLFNEAIALARGRTMLTHRVRANIFLILKYFMHDLPQGHIVEFGSFRGGNALFMAHICRELYPEMKVYAFDTFTGMPKADTERDGIAEGDLHQTDYDNLQNMIKREGFDNLVLVKGMFQDTAPEWLPKINSIRFAYMDSDYYESIAYSYDVSIPYMVDGGYWLFDDPYASTCVGAMDAVNDLVTKRDGRYAEQVYPQLVYRNIRENR